MDMDLESEDTEFQDAIDRILASVGFSGVALDAEGQEVKDAAALSRNDHLPDGAIEDVIRDAIDSAFVQVAEGDMEPAQLAEEVGLAYETGVRAGIEAGLVEGVGRTREWNAKKITYPQYRKPQERNLIATGEYVDSLKYRLEK